MKIIGLLTALVLLATPVFAGTLTANWAANPASDGIQYYSFYIDGIIVQGAEQVAVTTTTVDLTGLPVGLHYGTITATNIDGESVQSDPTEFKYGKPGKPQTLIITR